MYTNKIRTVAGMFLLASVVAIGGGLLGRQAVADEQSPPPPPQVRADAAVKEERKSAAADMPRDHKDYLEVRTDGKQVEVRAVLANEQIKAVAQQMSYDSGTRQLCLKGNVRVHRQRGQEGDFIECQRMVIDAKSAVLKVEGVGSMGRGVQMIGPAPAVLDFGFPFVKGPNREKAGEKQGQPKATERKPADADIPSMKKELEELRERVKKLEKRLSSAGAAKDFATAEFYRRTGHSGAAYFYYELVSNRYPQSVQAGEAKECMGKMRRQMGS